jgi:hypothetical protein
MALCESMLCRSVEDPCFDFLGAIYCLRAASSIQWDPLHSKGHQDRHLAMDELSDFEKFNIEMNHTAKAFLPTA